MRARRRPWERHPTSQAGLAVVAALAVAAAPALAGEGAAGGATPATAARPEGGIEGLGGLGLRGAPPAAPVASSAETREAVRAFVRARSAEVQGCYEARLAAEPALQGTVTLRWQVAPDGAASGAAVVPEKTTVTDGPLLGCLRDRVNAWRFPRPGEAHPMVVTFPWTFRPSRPPPKAAAPAGERPVAPGR